MKIKQLAAAVLLLAFLLAGCGKTQTGSGSAADPAVGQSGSAATPLNTADMFTDRDKKTDWQEADCTKITLNGTSASAESGGVSISGSTVTITKEGEYLLSGTLTNGQIVVNADKLEKVRLILNSVNINCDTSAAIYVKQAYKVFLTLAENSDNTLSNKSDFVAIDDNNIDAVIFSKEDMTLNGSGKLTVKAAYGHGIVSKDDLVFAGGSYNITAASHGIAGKDSVRVMDGSFTLTTGKDGIHAENTDDAALGYAYIQNGSFAITAETDGIDAAGTLQIEKGSFELKTGGGSQNASTSNDGGFNPDWGGWGRRGGMENPGAAGQQSSTAADTPSAKGLKATGDLMINGGSFTVDSSDDSLHSNANLTVAGGTLHLSSGDDGIHADGQTAVTGGELTISKSYEGIEGKSIEISGGKIRLTASDDGLNAAGGNDQSGLGGRPGMGNFNADADVFIKISGGTINISAGGDGVDSNGSLSVTGGETYVSGPTNSGNGALDYDGEGQITGGIFVAVGAAGMAQNFSSTSTQGAMLVNLSGSAQAGEELVLKDSGGKALVSYTPEKQYSSVVISCPGLEKGQTYTLLCGGESITVEMTSLITGSGSGMGGGDPGGMGGGMHGGKGGAAPGR